MSLRARLRIVRRFGLWLHKVFLPATPRSFEEQVFAAFVRPGDVVFDIGANIGLTSLFFAKLVGRKGLVLAFEPVTETYLQLSKSASSFSFWKSDILPFNLGFFSEGLVTTMSVPDGVHELASLAPANRWITKHGASSAKTQHCAFFQLDQFLSNPGIPHPSFVKIDVEGAEKHVIEGAELILQSDTKPVLFIEVFAPWQRAFGYTPYDFFRLFQASTYEMFFLCPSGLIKYSPTADQPFPAEYVGGYNVLAIPRERRDLIELTKRFSPCGGTRLLKMQPPPEPNTYDEPST